jgi:hypothetical protein
MPIPADGDAVWTIFPLTTLDLPSDLWSSTRSIGSRGNRAALSSISNTGAPRLVVIEVDDVGTPSIVGDLTLSVVGEVYNMTWHWVSDDVILALVSTALDPTPENASTGTSPVRHYVFRLSPTGTVLGSDYQELGEYLGEYGPGTYPDQAFWDTQSPTLISQWRRQVYSPFHDQVVVWDWTNTWGEANGHYKVWTRSLTAGAIGAPVAQPDVPYENFPAQYAFDFEGNIVGDTVFSNQHFLPRGLSSSRWFFHAGSYVVVHFGDSDNYDQENAHFIGSTLTDVPTKTRNWISYIRNRQPWNPNANGMNGNHEAYWDHSIPANIEANTIPESDMVLDWGDNDTIGPVALRLPEISDSGVVSDARQFTIPVPWDGAFMEANGWTRPEAQVDGTYRTALTMYDAEYVEAGYAFVEDMFGEPIIQYGRLPEGEEGVEIAWTLTEEGAWPLTMTAQFNEDFTALQWTIRTWTSAISTAISGDLTSSRVRFT